MKTIEINDNVLSKLTKLNVNSVNIESDLYIIDDKYLFKRFLDDDSDFLKEKLKKLKYLTNITIEGTTKPVSIVNNNDQFIGYIMPYIKESVELKDIRSLNITQEQIFEIFSKLSSTLEQMHKNNIIYGDIGESNIIVDNNLNPYFVDMDGALVNNIGRSNIPKILFNNKFIDDFKPSFELDITLLNMVFVNILSNKKSSVLNENEFIKTVNELQIDDDLKRYFCQIPNRLQKEYATNYFKKIKQHTK